LDPKSQIQSSCYNTFMSDQKSKTLILFDGNALLHRAFHAFPLTLQTKSGELTNATYGFTSTLLTIFKKLKPTHAAVAFDEKGPTLRKEKYDFYKAHRPKMDDSLVSQIQRTREVVDTLNIPRFNISGYEADDLIGTIKTRAEPDVDHIYIVTGDRDLLQLLSVKANVVFPARGKTAEKNFNPELFEAEYQFKPLQLIDYKALAGDQSDEIPGVNGIGPKTATDLIIKYGSLEGIYNHLDDIKASVREKLARDRANAFLSKELATIQLDVPLQFDLDKARLTDYDQAKAVELFNQLEFFSLVRRLPKDYIEDIFLNSEITEERVKKAEDQMSLF